MSSIRWSSRPLVVKPTRTKMRMKTKTRTMTRSEEHTSELQSHSDIVCRLLLEKKKNLRELYYLGRPAARDGHRRAQHRSNAPVTRIPTPYAARSSDPHAEPYTLYRTTATRVQA